MTDQILLLSLKEHEMKDVVLFPHGFQLLQIWVVQLLQTSPLALRAQDDRFKQGRLAYTYISVFSIPFMSRARAEYVEFIKSISSYFNGVSSTLFHNRKTNKRKANRQVVKDTSAEK